MKANKFGLAALALAATIAAAPAAAQGSFSGCSIGLFGSCASWTISRTLGGGFSDFSISVTNTTPLANGAQIFRNIFVFVPTTITESSVSNFVANPVGYVLAGAPFNGQIWSGGVQLGSNQSIIDWESSPGAALALNDVGTFTFRLPGTVSVTRLGVHAQRGPNGNSQWIELTPSVVVPEPSTYALVASGLAALTIIARRRRRA